MNRYILHGGPDDGDVVVLPEHIDVCFSSPTEDLRDSFGEYRLIDGEMYWLPWPYDTTKEWN